jgi:hypothetical protein
MRVSSFFLFAAIATETVSAQGILRRRNDDNRVRALVEEVSMSADLSLSFSFGGTDDAEIAGIGKAGKNSKAIGKSGKSSQKPTTMPTDIPTTMPTAEPSQKPTTMPTAKQTMSMSMSSSMSTSMSMSMST